MLKCLHTSKCLKNVLRLEEGDFIYHFSAIIFFNISVSTCSPNLTQKQHLEIAYIASKRMQRLDDSLDSIKSEVN